MSWRSYWIGQALMTGSELPAHHWSGPEKGRLAFSGAVADGWLDFILVALIRFPGMLDPG